MRTNGSRAMASGAILVLGISTVLTADDASIITLIDFEEFDESTEITDQYAASGVWFSIAGDPALSPIIAKEGSPVVAFTGSSADTPMSSQSAGLSDPVIDGEPFSPNDIVLTFDPPVTSVRFYVIDIDSGDLVTTRAFFEGAEVAVDVHASGDPGTGNGVSTLFTVAAPAIDEVLIDVDNTSQANVGYAIDFLTFTRPCTGSTCGPFVRVAQESAPGAGDFDDNLLGDVLIHQFFGSPAGFYAYNVPSDDSWNGQALDPVSQRSHILFSQSNEGPTLYVIHDRPGDGTGGDAEMRIEILGDPDGAVRSVEDDPESQGVDFYDGEPGDTLFTSEHSWNACCTDGLAISDLDCAWEAIVSFSDVDRDPSTPTIRNIEEWVVYSPSGEEIPLALEVDRRVRLEFVPAGSCPPDMNFNGAVEVTDLLTLLAAWGPCDPVCTLCPPDFDGDTEVDVSDLLTLLAAWGPCE